MQSNRPASVLIAAPPGGMSSSLRTFLSTIPNLRISAQARTRAEMIHAMTSAQPRLALIDVDLISEDIPAALTELRQLFPALRLVLLANNAAQQAAALSAGAGKALLKGFLNDQLRAALNAELPNLAPSDQAALPQGRPSPVCPKSQEELAP